MSTDKSCSRCDPNHALLKSSGVVAGGVLTSRLLGFVRDVILARFLGTGLLAEAFFVAQRIPNLLRDMAGEGAANAAIVPTLTEYAQKKTAQDWQQCINAVMTWGLIILGTITVIGILAAPLIVRLIAPGFIAQPEKLHLTINLTRIMFPYLVLIALTAFQAGILYSLNAFFAPAFGPCLLNVAMILSVWVACLFSLPLAYTISIGVLVGGIWQFWVQFSALARRGVHWKLSADFRNEGALKIGRLMLPRLWGSAVYQINVFVDTFCASLAFIVGAGGIAAIYYANRMIQLPLGVFGYALSSVALPSLSRLAQEKDMARFKSTLFFALRNLVLVLALAGIGMAFFSKWIIHIIFQRGAFDAYSTSVTARVMFYAALGLPFFGASRILVSAFYALQDTKTPVKTATVCLVINIVLNVALMFPLKIGGIALASSIAGAVNCLLLWNALQRRLK
ncbi:MAG: murein biosynthesis integral membrane protein MurJ [Candidatus Omnitrophica bacterium]|nr:murein biosynthesis integral membrane protein MurJ [Candidatus Omnitrophota bacterium]MDE2009928.1 murein biosynthesis integral membrane protein MurJ [Candidatus Omnitrophota bacterium]MDE2215016.1 murein biosynthesis integral membrane protein MurJ [Candidatus Omnitrophota bacterium]MDE2232188.1 murein biosynthesis integral membrane protein MurJ [Candidatus Omnitrophota bacterium]